jgi:hypothetical protein
MDEDDIADALKSQRLGRQMPGIRGVSAHVTEPMHRPLLEALQKRWLDIGDYWERSPIPGFVTWSRISPRCTKITDRLDLPSGR